MTKVYFLYIVGLCPHCLAYSSPNSWNFLSVESNNSISCYVNTVTSGPHLRMELIARRTKPVTGGL